MYLPLSRRLAVLAVFLLVTAGAFAEEPWDAPAFSSDPKALIAAAEKVAPGDKGVVLLLDEATYSYEADGSTRTTSRLMYRVVSEAAVAPNAQVEANWAPWYDAKPVITARVVTKSGTVHALDANAVTEAPARDSSLDIFSDNRILRAPLPAVEVGAVVEYVITVDGRSPIAGAGTSSVFAMARGVPVQRTRLVLDAPLSLEPRIVNHSAVQPTVEEKDGRRRTTFVQDRTEPDDKIEYALPYDEAAYPYVAFSTGSSWQQIAANYAKIVDAQIAGSDLQKLVRTAVGNATDRREIIARALAAIQKDVRYAGVEIGEASIVPRAPSVVLKNKYGDCKDKATLLVAMLRAAGVPANVALLRAGTDRDVDPTLPGLGLFNHAIVRVESIRAEDAPIWVDPTDEFARAGELPIEDQGRMALIAMPATTALTLTPESLSAANHYNETRTFYLPEEGKARVVEVTEAAGVEDSWQRRYYATSEAKRYREGMEDYVKSYYFAKSLAKMDATDPHDLAHPFRLTLEATDSGSGIVKDGEGVVALHPGALFNGLPPLLRDWKEPQPNDDPKDAHKTRVHDFLMPVPKVREWTYRIVPPAGYAARTLPAGATRSIGALTYTTAFSTEPDGVVVAKLTLDTGKRRMTAAEFEETRVAIGKLGREPQIEIGFDLVGQARLNEGDVAGALAEFRKLGALHPKEAQHHIEVARALLAGGLGDAARDEARKAVAIEPKNAHAYEMLAVTLKHDLLGRPFRAGVDIPGAIAAYRKAKELDPEDLDVRVGLARVLTAGDDGAPFGRNARVIDAIDEYRALAKDIGEKAQAYDGELMMALAQAGHFQELLDFSATSSDKQRRNLGRILAIAAMQGKDAALRELSTFDLDTRRSYAGELGKYLLAIRLYPQAAAMLEASVQGTAQASKMALYIDTVRKARRIEDVPAADGDPADLMRKLFMAVARGDREGAMALMPAELRERTKKKQEKDGNDPFFTLVGNEAKGADLPPSVMADVMYSMVQVKKEGNDDTGYRLRLQLSVEVRDADYSLFVTRDDGHYMLRASSDDESVGIAALRFVELGKADTARQWLNWTRESMEAFGGDDPLGGAAFPRLWPKAKAAATADEVRLAATVFVAEHTGEMAKELENFREKAENDETRTLIDRALAHAYSIKSDWTNLLPVARRLLAKEPDSGIAFTSVVSALSFTGKTAEAQQIAKQRLERLPKDRDALRGLSLIAAAASDYATAEKYSQQVVDDVKPDRADYNNAAWYGLFTGDLEHAMENAHRATTGDKSRETSAAFHTLAALCAETGKTLEAREALLDSMDQRQRDQPESIDWYVLGRIAEVYGVRDAAIAAYKRVEKDETPGGTVWQLTTRRMGLIK
jgi:transglutaminase-like putative cysteine protease/Tfp pilus assembly protein PilF